MNPEHPRAQLGLPGSVARKIALFQFPDPGGLLPVAAASGTLRLRRKDGIKRKKSTNTVTPKAPLAECDTVSIDAASTLSSDSCYGGSSLDGSLETASEKFGNPRNRRGARTMRDCYQSFTLPNRPNFGHLQLVEFSPELSSGGGGEASQDGFYQELISDQSESRLPSTNGHIPPSIIHGESEEKPPSPPPYESIYAEPIYGDTGSSGGSSSYWTPPPSLYSASNPTPSHFQSSVLFNNTSISPSAAAARQGRRVTPNRHSFDPATAEYPPSELPPLPSPNPTPNKFSSIAKSAGRKLVKKLDYIRRFSRTTSMDGLTSSMTTDEPLSLPSQPTNHSSSLYNVSQSSSTCTTTSKVLKRPTVARPRIPPPAPPPPPMTFRPTPKKELRDVGGKNVEDEFEDSDFCDSDSELIRNFVSAVQPIYSMEEEPLYQYYTYGISLQPEDDYQPVIPKNLGLTLEMLIPRQGQRTLWCEIPEVTNSGILGILSDKQKQLQESIFEILTSEVSYLKSLDVLVTLFYENEDLLQVLSETDRAALFGNIKAVKESARSFLTELLGKWEESWYIQEVGSLIIQNTRDRFGVYVDYCRNKPYQDRTLQRLRNSSDEFLNVVKSIEEDRRCELLRMDSFLMLPMQRITRLPLLVNAIIQRTQNVKEKVQCEEALKALTNLVIECNEGARESQDLEETGRMMERLEFPRGLRPLRNPGQFLLKGDFMKNPFDSGRGGAGKINWTFQKSKRTYYWLILFTQQLFIAKKRSSGKLEVVETISPKESHIKKLPSLDGISSEFQHYFMLHFDGRDAIYFLASRTQSEVERWRNKLDEVRSVKELILRAIFPYQAEREDELSFSIGDVIRVSQKQPDGWYFGSTEAGSEGWFPGNYAEEEKITTKPNGASSN